MEQGNPLKVIGVLIVMFILLVVSIIILANRGTKFEVTESILDKKLCVDERYTIYEDDTLIYYLNCDKTYIITIDDKEYTINDALNQKLITIDDLKNKDIEIYSQNK